MSTTNKFTLSPENQALFEEAKVQYTKDKEQFGEDIARELLKKKRNSDRGEAYRSEKQSVNHHRNQAKREIVQFDADEQALEARREDIDAKREALGLDGSTDSTSTVSDYPHLHPADNVSLDPEQNGGKILNEGYLEYEGKKVPMFRNQAIQQAFDEMGITVKDFEKTTEGKKQATTYLQELFKDYKADFPDAFAETDWFGTYNKTKFKFFDKRAKDHGLDYAGYRSLDGKHGRSGETLYSWLPVRIGGKFAFLWSHRNDEEANCSYGDESDAVPVAVVEN